jgi:hypothetical protein
MQKRGFEGSKNASAVLSPLGGLGWLGMAVCHTQRPPSEHAGRKWEAPPSVLVLDLYFRPACTLRSGARRAEQVEILPMPKEKVKFSRSWTFGV